MNSCCVCSEKFICADMFGEVDYCLKCCLKLDDISFEEMLIDNSKMSEDFRLLHASAWTNSQTLKLNKNGG
jgi:hypothetical protein